MSEAPILMPLTPLGDFIEKVCVALPAMLET